MLSKLKKISFVIYIVILQLIIQILNVVSIVDNRAYRFTLFFFFIPVYWLLAFMKLWRYFKSKN